MRTWPTVMEQYRRPNDARYYDLPIERYDSLRLYHRMPHIGVPKYRGMFRDKPHTVASYYPEGMECKPKGFHGRLYYEHGNPKKYEGRVKDDLYWLEHAPYSPHHSRPLATHNKHEALRSVNPPPVGTRSVCPPHSGLQTSTGGFPGTSSSYKLNTYLPIQSSNKGNASKEKSRVTMDGVGYL